MTTIYLVRHAEAEGNLYRRIHGWYDSKVTEKGKRQIAALERRFAPIHVDAAYSSDLVRTMTTAMAVCRPKGLKLHTTPALREVGMGEWEDLTWGQAARLDPEALRRFSAGVDHWGDIPGCEDFSTVQSRVWGALEEIARNHPDQTVAVFCHGMAIRTVLARCQGLPLEGMNRISHSDNTGVALFTMDGGKPTLIHGSDASHLDESLSTLAKQRWWKEKEGALADANLWFRPLDMDREEKFYRDSRAEAWLTVHGSMDHFDGDAFCAVARENSRTDPHGVTCAMLGDTQVGLIQMDFRREAEQKAGWIPFYYMTPQGRSRGLGIQLLGEAVSRFRAAGREKLRLRCAPENEIAQRFYREHGFVKIGEDPTSPVPLDIMEKYIGYGDLKFD